MTIHEFGKDGQKVIVLIHPSAVMWDYFKAVIPLLEEQYHLILPALPGYDEARPEEAYTSVEAISDELAAWLTAHGMQTVDVLYGCSMGGSVVLRMLAEQKLTVKNAVCDGAITPYQLPRLVTRPLIVRDFLFLSLFKFGGVKLLEKAITSDEYNRENLRYIAKVFRFASYKTIWNNMDSCNTYSMPEQIPPYSGRLQYWYGSREKASRARDLKYIKAHFPHAEFIEHAGMEHASMATTHPQEMAKELALLAQ